MDMNWSDIPSAKMLRHLIQQQLELILPSVHGYSLITLGQLSKSFDYSKAEVAKVVSIQNRITGDVCAYPHQLPLASDDIDAIFIPLLIEQSDFPHQLLREASRSLRPGGKLILVAFNPFSFWGAYKLALGRTGRKPWNCSFYRPGRIKDWMSLLGMEIKVEHGLFSKCPGYVSNQLDNHLTSLNYSRFGAINFIVAEKQIKTLTAIRPQWKERKVVSSRFAEPTGKIVKIP